jgi:hypothetical protein
MDTVWVAGKVKGWGGDGHNSWDLQGVFSTADAANAVCTSPLHFYGPVPFNQRLPEDSVSWPGVVYPVTE